MVRAVPTRLNQNMSNSSLVYSFHILYSFSILLIVISLWFRIPLMHTRHPCLLVTPFSSKGTRKRVARKGNARLICVETRSHWLSANIS